MRWVTCPAMLFVTSASTLAARARTLNVRRRPRGVKLISSPMSAPTLANGVRKQCSVRKPASALGKSRSEANPSAEDVRGRRARLSKLRRRLQVIGEITEPTIVRLVLESLALPTEAPPIVRARVPGTFLPRRTPADGEGGTDTGR